MAQLIHCKHAAELLCCPALQLHSQMLLINSQLEELWYCLQRHVTTPAAAAEDERINYEDFSQVDILRKLHIAAISLLQLLRASAVITLTALIQAAGRHPLHRGFFPGQVVIAALSFQHADGGGAALWSSLGAQVRALQSAAAAGQDRGPATVGAWEEAHMQVAHNRCRLPAEVSAARCVLVQARAESKRVRGTDTLLPTSWAREPAQLLAGQSGVPGALRAAGRGVHPGRQVPALPQGRGGRHLGAVLLQLRHAQECHAADSERRLACHTAESIVCKHSITQGTVLALRAL